MTRSDLITQAVRNVCAKNHMTPELLMRWVDHRFTGYSWQWAIREEFKRLATQGEKA